MPLALGHKISAALLGVGAASLLATGVANAAPTVVHGPPAKHIPASTPVPGTNCTYGQASAALAKEDPKLWAKITKDSHYRAHFQEGIMLTKKQRDAKDEQWRQANPVQSAALEAAEKMGAFGTPGQSAKDRQQFSAALDRARATCASF